MVDFIFLFIFLFIFSFLSLTKKINKKISIFKDSKIIDSAAYLCLCREETHLAGLLSKPRSLLKYFLKEDQKLIPIVF